MPIHEKTYPFGRRGFASMAPAKQLAIASKGGRAAHEQGVAHEFTAAEASAAATKAHAMGTAHEFNSDEGRIAGRKGAKARAAKARRHFQSSMISPAHPCTPTLSPV